MNKKHKWTKRQAKNALVPNFGKKYVTQPALLKLIGVVKNKRVLELGSGNGYWLELLSQRGASCTGVEISKKQINLAKERNSSPKIRYIQGDITNLEKYNLKSNSYDVVFLEHALLEISSIKKLEKIFNGIYKLLKKDGISVISDLHPFAPSAKPDNLKTSKKFNYFSSGDIISLVSKRIDGKEISYKDFHWTLGDIVKPITKSGLKIIEIIEPRPPVKIANKYAQLAYRLKTPMSIMLKVIK